MIKGNEPAFPFSYNDNTPGEMCAHPGMTLRDWFAGQALTGLVQSQIERRIISAENLASVAFNIADAMLKERDNKED